MAELAEVRNVALERMESAVANIERRQAEYSGILEARTRLQRAFLQHLDYLEQCGNDLLATYREANRMARNTLSPSHFSQRWKLLRPADLASGPQGDLGGPTMEAEIGRLFKQLQEKRESVHREYETAVSNYERIDTLTPEVLRDDGFRST
jgi:hypothetical protein